jgi:hypothetical protein
VNKSLWQMPLGLWQFIRKDADYSCLTVQTKNRVLISFGVLRITLSKLEEAVNAVSEFILDFVVEYHLF